MEDLQKGDRGRFLDEYKDLGGAENLAIKLVKKTVRNGYEFT